MNVLHIMRDLSAGGPQNLLLDMIRENRDTHQYSFFIIFNKSVTQARLNLFTSGAHAEKIDYDGSGLSVLSSYIKKIRDCIRVNKIDIIHCHNNIDAYIAALAALPYNLKGWFKRPKQHVKVFLTVHGMTLNLNYLSEFFFGDLDPDISEKSIRRLDRMFLRHFYICFESKAAREFYLRDYHQYPEIDSDGGILLESAVIHNGVYVPRIASALPVSYNDLNASVMHYPGSEKFSLPEDKMYFAMIGGFSSYAQRNQMLVCEAIYLVKKRLGGDLPFAFLFLGRSTFVKDLHRVKEQDVPDSYPDRDEMADCLQFCREHDLEGDIFFLQPEVDVPSLLKTISCYVYSSDQDTFGISVVEAIISGVQVICSKTPVFEEITLGGELAYLAENSAEDFAEAMLNFLMDKKEEKSESPESIMFENEVDEAEIAQRCSRAKELYSIGRCLSDYKKVYDKI